MTPLSYQASKCLPALLRDSIYVNLSNIDCCPSEASEDPQLDVIRNELEIPFFDIVCLRAFLRILDRCSEISSLNSKGATPSCATTRRAPRPRVLVLTLPVDLSLDRSDQKFLTSRYGSFGIHTVGIPSAEATTRMAKCSASMGRRRRVVLGNDASHKRRRTVKERSRLTKALKILSDMKLSLLYK